MHGLLERGAYPEKIMALTSNLTYFLLMSVTKKKIVTFTQEGLVSELLDNLYSFSICTGCSGWI
jgi:hypothetical protein